MTLTEHLATTGQSVTAFAAKLREAGVSVSDVSVSRYCNGRRTPRPEIMEGIRRLTNDAVQPNDWFGERARAA